MAQPMTTYLDLPKRAYSFGLIIEGKWQRSGAFGVLEKGLLLDIERLHGHAYQSPTNSLVFGKQGQPGRAGRITFDPLRLVFRGLVSQSDGTLLSIVGGVDYDLVYLGSSRPSGTSDPLQPGPSFEIRVLLAAGNDVVTYWLAGTDVTSRVVVSDYDPGTDSVKLTLLAGLFGSGDSFKITMSAGLGSFAGTYTTSAGAVLDWNGTLAHSAVVAAREALAYLEAVWAQATTCEVDAAIFASVSESAWEDTVSLPGLDAQDRIFLAEMAKQNLTPLNLDNVSSIEHDVDAHGKVTLVDNAHKTTAMYLNTAYLNGLDQKWINELLGTAPPMDATVTSVFQQHQLFFQGQSVTTLGTILKQQSDRLSQPDQAAMAPVSLEKLKASWSSIATSRAKIPAFQAASSALFVHAYSEVVPDFRAYEQGDRAAWGRAYFHWLQQPEVMHSWQGQLMVMQPDEVGARIFDWHNKLGALAPDQTYAADMLKYALASIISGHVSGGKWLPGGGGVLAEVMSQASKLAPAVPDPTVNANQAAFAALAAAIDLNTFAKAVDITLSNWQKNNADAPVVNYIWATPALMQQILTQLPTAMQAPFATWIQNTDKAAAGGSGNASQQLLSFAVYAAIAVLLIYQFSTPPADPSVPVMPPAMDSPEWLAALKILRDVKIGQVVFNSANTLYQALFVTALASFWERAAASAIGLVGAIGAWVSRIRLFLQGGAEIAEVGAIVVVGTLTKLLRVVAPVLAVVGLVITGINMASDIENGRWVDLAADIMSAVVGLAAVGVGIAVLAGMAAAGPVGWVIAAIGLVIFLFKWIWDLFNPPQTPVQAFVSGPLTAQGFLS
jgi:hypothetical protein